MPCTTPTDASVSQPPSYGNSSPTRTSTRLAIFSLDVPPELAAEARAAGASGLISKRLAAEDIADALVRIAGGEFVEALGHARQPAYEHLDWPGKRDGVSERESEVLVLCAQGLTNREIAAALYIGTETVKTHLRNVFGKLGLRNRVEVVAYLQRTGAFVRS